MDYITLISEQLGIPIWSFLIILAWSQIWKFLALWKSARNNSTLWFIIFALVNTVGILEILYLFGFSRMKTNNFRSKKMRKNRRK